jgi:hypothetical protein
MRTVSRLLFTVRYVLGAVWELARYVFRFCKRACPSLCGSICKASKMKLCDWSACQKDWRLRSQCECCCDSKCPAGANKLENNTCKDKWCTLHAVSIAAPWVPPAAA